MNRLTPLQKKIFTSLITVFVALSFTFALMRLMPGDIVDEWARELQVQQGLTYQEAYKIATTRLNYDPSVPLPLQYARYIGGLLKGNLGMSLNYRIPVSTIILKALPWTLFVASLALLVSFTVGVFLGMLAAWKRKGFLDPCVTFYASLTQAIPNFLFALILLVVFAVRLRWFPLRGAYDIDVVPGFNLAFFLSAFHHAVLPVVAFTFQTLGGWALSMRASAMSVLGEDFVMVARAKGLKERRIAVQYVGRNAITPLITSLAIAIGGMLGGAIFIETIFGYPGVGFFFGTAIATRDFTLIQGLFLITTLAIIIANFAADIVYSKLDKRVKLE
ncbi:MAG: ABC transporter permease [Elusimicrobia bacterium]|nr:ABC transporter permease [Elusimicrobiota bacterium]